MHLYFQTCFQSCSGDIPDTFLLSHQVKVSSFSVLSTSVIQTASRMRQTVCFWGERCVCVDHQNIPPQHIIPVMLQGWQQ